MEDAQGHSGEARYGLPEAVMEDIARIFARHPGIEKALLYGSRAKGTQKPGSDIDLAVMGPTLVQRELAQIESEIDELLLPYSVDIAVYSEIENLQLTEHIDRVGIAVYVRGDAAAMHGKEAGGAVGEPPPASTAASR